MELQPKYGTYILDIDTRNKSTKSDQEAYRRGMIDCEKSHDR